MSILKVIPVHGVWEHPLPTDPTATPAYTYTFVANVTAELQRIGIIPPNATPAETAAIVSFDPTWYGDVGAAEERQVYTDYRKSAAKLENVFDKALDLVGIDRLRRFVIDAASDVLVYQSDIFRETIRNRLRARIAAAIAGGDKAVTVVGHSLGSVVAYDVAYYDSWYSQTWQAANFQLANLFTLGSPLPLFTLGFDATGKPRPKYSDPASVKKLIRPGGLWYNFFDAQDVVGYPLEARFPGLVTDFLVDVGTLPTHAHSNMWHSATVARELARALAADYRRVTTS